MTDMMLILLLNCFLLLTDCYTMFIYIYDLIYNSLAMHHTQTGPIGTRKFSPKKKNFARPNFSWGNFEISWGKLILARFSWGICSLFEEYCPQEVLNCCYQRIKYFWWLIMLLWSSVNSWCRQLALARWLPDKFTEKDNMIRSSSTNQFHNDWWRRLLTLQ